MAVYRIGDTILAPKKLTEDAFSAKLRWIQCHPMQYPPERYDRVTITNKCECGGEEFRIHVPQFVVTVATCTKCNKSGIIHEG